MFQKPSVATVVARFNRMIDDLQNIISSSEAEAADIAQRIEELKAARQNAQTEAQQAETIIANLRSLIAA